MSAGGFLDVCGFIPVSSGTGSFVDSAAVVGYQRLGAAGAVNALVYSYRAESADKSQWEEGFGAATVSAGTWTLARTIITANSSGGTTAIAFSAAPNVYITAASADLQNASLLTNGTVATARLGSGTASSTTFLAGDQTYKTITVPTLNGLISSVPYTSTQTITILGTRAKIRGWGGSGGGAGSSGGSTNGGGGGGGAGYFEKTLTGLTVGNTLALTVGAAGSAGGGSTNGGAGGATSLASGTQTITTLTANGGGAGLAASGGGAGGTATNGDWNVTGQKGTAGFEDSGSGNPYPGNGGVSGGGRSVGGNPGTGGGAGSAGIIGGCDIEWFS